MIVYRPDGVAEEKENCDARECVKHCGYSFEAPVVKTDTPVEAAVDDSPKRGRTSKFDSNEI